MNHPSIQSHLAVCYGELLWDLLPSGPQPGGAPMNVAYHLHKLGCHPAMITRIGIDERGRKLLDILEGKGVCTNYIQLDYDLPTGIVHAQQDARGDMQYDIVSPAAWDHIVHDATAAAVVEASPYFICGSLAARNHTSRNTLFALLEAANTRVLDINLRAPHYSRSLIEDLLGKAHILKMNADELELVTGWFARYQRMEDRIQLVQDRFHLSTILITRGAHGAILNMEGQLHRHPGYQVPVTDTVGSGDAFLAATIAMLIKKSDPRTMLDFANRLAATITTYKGACPDYDINETEHQPS
ncbi:carbohydrate kinase [uncultured Chitinophaga sp.]|jgi:Sugar kinases, ribokinase family|uniref:carbohydrate kinase family protein n=1 Tax=uncultured Chitinophaga sp. TaxID=339340 RepID=UPI00261AD315|nr:carbohydrate kinase [uncultured Chitinophaga sp.]